MFPVAMFFSRTNRPPPKPRSVLDEEYEWVFQRGPRASQRRGRLHPAEGRDESEND